ncbi:hypothetical protein FOL47_007478 [Perkinsus chesapeaki]|uniref:malate dehydrogenase n=1 Tax=Perkinsus chesapeaki TaxID=330153 RepID=A0A7J6LK86_PERCH|nr:hypothetical protein FOL47_007478 [Perkinsus chesapeaki]
MSRTIKVTVIGASSHIGGNLSLLLKVNPRISEIALYDERQAKIPSPGVGADISHINTQTTVRAYQGTEELETALKEADFVIVCAGEMQKSDITADDLFDTNAPIVYNITKACAQHAKRALLCIMSEPVNSLVPMAAEVYKTAGVYNKARVLGITAIDSVRASTFYAEAAGLPPKSVFVPVIGGHSASTVLPLFSQATPKVKLNPAVIEELDKRVQNAEVDEVSAAMNGVGCSTLASAYAAARFIDVAIRGQHGEKVSACAYVNEPINGEVPFFAYRCDFGPQGVIAVQRIQNTMPAYEQKRLRELKNKLKVDIEKGVRFAIAASRRGNSTTFR